MWYAHSTCNLHVLTCLMHSATQITTHSAMEKAIASGYTRVSDEDAAPSPVTSSYRVVSASPAPLMHFNERDLIVATAMATRYDEEHPRRTNALWSSMEFGAPGDTNRNTRQRTDAGVGPSNNEEWKFFVRPAGPAVTAKLELQKKGGDLLLQLEDIKFQSYKIRAYLARIQVGAMASGYCCPPFFRGEQNNQGVEGVLEESTKALDNFRAARTDLLRLLHKFHSNREVVEEVGDIAAPQASKFGDEVQTLLTTLQGDAEAQAQAIQDGHGNLIEQLAHQKADFEFHGELQAVTAALGSRISRAYSDRQTLADDQIKKAKEELKTQGGGADVLAAYIQMLEGRFMKQTDDKFKEASDDADVEGTKWTPIPPLVEKDTDRLFSHTGLCDAIQAARVRQPAGAQTVSFNQRTWTQLGIKGLRAFHVVQLWDGSHYKVAGAPPPASSIKLQAALDCANLEISFLLDNGIISITTKHVERGDIEWAGAASKQSFTPIFAGGTTQTADETFVRLYGEAPPSNTRQYLIAQAAFYAHFNPDHAKAMRVVRGVTSRLYGGLASAGPTVIAVAAATAAMDEGILQEQSYFAGLLSGGRGAVSQANGAATTLDGLVGAALRVWYTTTGMSWEEATEAIRIASTDIKVQQCNYAPKALTVASAGTTAPNADQVEDCKYQAMTGRPRLKLSIGAMAALAVHAAMAGSSVANALVDEAIGKISNTVFEIWKQKVLASGSTSGALPLNLFGPPIATDPNNTEHVEAHVWRQVLSTDKTFDYSGYRRWVIQDVTEKIINQPIFSKEQAGAGAASKKSLAGLLEILKVEAVLDGLAHAYPYQAMLRRKGWRYRVGFYAYKTDQFIRPKAELLSDVSYWLQGMHIAKRGYQAAQLVGEMSTNGYILAGLRSIGAPGALLTLGLAQRYYNTTLLQGIRYNTNMDASFDAAAKNACAVFRRNGMHSIARVGKTTLVCYNYVQLAEQFFPGWFSTTVPMEGLNAVMVGTKAVMVGLAKWTAFCVALGLVIVHYHAPEEGPIPEWIPGNASWKSLVRRNLRQYHEDCQSQRNPSLYVPGLTEVMRAFDWVITDTGSRLETVFPNQQPFVEKWITTGMQRVKRALEELPDGGTSDFTFEATAILGLMQLVEPGLHRGLCGLRIADQAALRATEEAASAPQNLILAAFVANPAVSARLGASDRRKLAELASLALPRMNA